MSPRAVCLLSMLSLVGCGGPIAAGDDASVRSDAGVAIDAGAPDAGPALDAGIFDAGLTDSGVPDAGIADAGVPDAGLPDAGRADAGLTVDGGTYRNSLSLCWTDATCARVLAVAHGGAWDALNVPYDSDAALAAAYAAGIDGVKIDVRVTSDNVPVISHSSPLALFESLDCYNRVIETSTAAQVTACHRAPSSTEKFQRLDTVLDYLRGKMVVQLTVKRPQDYARVIQQIHAQNAEDFAFMEISTSELQTQIPALAGAGTIWYLIDVASNLAEVDTLLTINNPRAFMYEFDPSVALGNLVTTRLHPAGIRSFVYEKASTAAEPQFRGYFNAGYDVVSANKATDLVNARKTVNQARGVSPP